MISVEKRAKQAGQFKFNILIIIVKWISGSGAGTISFSNDN